MENKFHIFATDILKIDNLLYYASFIMYLMYVALR